jgi:hypothetical protein
LNNNTNDHDRGTNEDRLAATELVTNRKNENGTEQTANSVDGDNEALPCAAPAGFREVFEKSVRFDDTRHDTLIVTKEQEIGSSDGGNEHLKGSARCAPVCGHTLSVCRDSASHLSGIV